MGEVVPCFCGGLVSGFEKVLTTTKSGKAAWLIEASDSAEDGRKRVLAAARAVNNGVKLCGCFGNAELSLALGLKMQYTSQFCRGGVSSAGLWR